MADFEIGRCGETRRLGKYLIARLALQFEKTSSWRIENTSGEHLGWVKWYGPWRQYCFMLNTELVLNSRCLKDIEKFLNELNREHKEKKKNK